MAKNRNNGIDYVFSCYCLDFDRNYKLEVRGDQGISSKLDRALNPANLSWALILCVFNLKNRKER